MLTSIVFCVVRVTEAAGCRLAHQPHMVVTSIKMTLGLDFLLEKVASLSDSRACEFILC